MPNGQWRFLPLATSASGSVDLENAATNVNVGCSISIWEELKVEKAIPTKIENLSIYIVPTLVVIEKTIRAIHGGHHGIHEDDTFEKRVHTCLLPSRSNWI